MQILPILHSDCVILYYKGPRVPNFGAPVFNSLPINGLRCNLECNPKKKKEKKTQLIVVEENLRC